MGCYFRVVNLDRFQHYKDRNPPWIKLHASVLDHYEFSRLPDASKQHLMLIWLLASRTDNKVVWDEAWVGQRISATDPVDLSVLREAGFIDLLEDSSSETEGKAEQKTRARLIDRLPHVKDDPDLQVAFDLWNELAGEVGLPKARALTAERKRHIQQRLKDCDGLEGWKSTLDRVRQSDFLTGKRTKFRASLDFVLKRANFLKITEGNYADSQSTNSMQAMMDELGEEPDDE